MARENPTPGQRRAMTTHWTCADISPADLAADIEPSRDTCAELDEQIAIEEKRIADAQAAIFDAEDELVKLKRQRLARRMRWGR